MRYLGGFVSVAGGLVKAIEHGKELGVNTIMIHPSPPQRWCTKPFAQEQIDAFNKARPGSGIEKLFFHGIYLINLAKTDKQQFHLSKLSLVHYLNLANDVKADGVVFHVGSFKDTTEEEGYARINKGLDWIFSESENDRILLLECAAGAGAIVGDKLEELAKIYESSKHKDRIGFCLDTQHMFASGYDLINDADGVIDQVDKYLGLENVHAVHFNDSKTDFDSKRDRHENLGEGKIGKEAMSKILNNKKLAHVSFILETPGMKDLDTAKIEIEKLRAWAKSV